MTKEQIMPNNLTEQLKNLSTIPNAPFLYKAPSMYLESFAQSNSFIPMNETNTEEQKLIAKDMHGLYLRIKRGNPFLKILITSHLDHPFIIIDQNNIGANVGSINYKLPIESPIPVRVYSKNGEFIDKSEIIHSKGNKNKINTLFDSKQIFGANSQAIWDINPVIISNGKIKMISSDDISTTAACLFCIKEIAKDMYPVDVQFCFTYVEEIRQISATGIALNGTPFGKIDEKTIVIPLESDYVEMSNLQREKIKHSRLNIATYEKGLIIRINDTEIVYAQNHKESNVAENLAIQASHKSGIQYQQGIMGSSCDGTSFTLFTSTPHIVSLTIPTSFKHNTDENGNIVHEEIKQEDLISLTSVIREITILSGQELETHNVSREQISTKAKLSPLAATNKQITKLRQDRIGAYYSSLERLKTGIFFPETANDKRKFIIGGINARVKKRKQK